MSGIEKLKVRLKQLRKENDMTQKDLADKLGIVRTAIANYETGRATPDSETLSLIASILNVSTDYLLGRTDIRSIEEVHTIAAHHDGDEYTEEELQEIENFKKYVLSKRKKD